MRTRPARVAGVQGLTSLGLLDQRSDDPVRMAVRIDVAGRLDVVTEPIASFGRFDPMERSPIACGDDPDDPYVAVEPGVAHEEIGSAVEIHIAGSRDDAAEERVAVGDPSIEGTDGFLARRSRCEQRWRSKFTVWKARQAASLASRGGTCPRNCSSISASSWFAHAASAQAQT